MKDKLNITLEGKKWTAISQGKIGHLDTLVQQYISLGYQTQLLLVGKNHEVLYVRKGRRSNESKLKTHFTKLEGLSIHHNKTFCGIETDSSHITTKKQLVTCKYCLNKLEQQDW
jgi:hypothetical protein